MTFWTGFICGALILAVIVIIYKMTEQPKDEKWYQDGDADYEDGE